MAFIPHPTDPQSFYVPVHVPPFRSLPGWLVDFQSFLAAVGQTEIPISNLAGYQQQREHHYRYSFRVRLLERPEIKWLEARKHYFVGHIDDMIYGSQAPHFRVEIPDKQAAIQFTLKCNDEMMPVISAN